MTDAGVEVNSEANTGEARERVLEDTRSELELVWRSVLPDGSTGMMGVMLAKAECWDERC